MIKKSSTPTIQGFTLIELSIVLVIIGLLVGLGAGMIGPMTTFVKVRETRDMQDASLQSIVSWASSRNTIPHAYPPADPLYVSNTAFTTVAKSPLDAWGRNLIYLYDPNLYSATPTKDTICGRRSTALTLVTTEPAATISNVAFTLLSGADYAALKSSLNGTLSGAPITGVINASGAAAGTITVTGPNSDLVRWVTLDELRSKVGCQGAPLKIVNNELPFGAVPNAYSVTLTADGGVPFSTPATYKWCVTLPAGFAQTGGTSNADCLNLAEASWATDSAGLTITFPANTVVSGAYQIKVVVRDNADGVTTSNACNNADPGDNCAQKLFVVTVNPQ